MKSTILKLAGIFIVALCIVSCSKSNKDLINDYSKLCEEVTQAFQEGNMDKVMELSDKGAKLEKELADRDLTDEEKTEVAKITANMAMQLSGSMMNGLNLMNEAVDAVNAADDSDDADNAPAEEVEVEEEVAE